MNSWEHNWKLLFPIFGEGISISNGITSKLFTNKSVSRSFSYDDYSVWNNEVVHFLIEKSGLTLRSCDSTEFPFTQKDALRVI